MFVVKMVEFVLFPIFLIESNVDTVDTGRKLDVNKTLKRRPGRFLNVFYTFSLRPVSSGEILVISFLSYVVFAQES